MQVIHASDVNLITAPPSLHDGLVAPPSPPEEHDLLGVRIVIAIIWLIGTCIVGGLMRRWRALIMAAPSVQAIVGTRWCTGASPRGRAALFAFRFTLAVWQVFVIVALCVSFATNPSKAKTMHDWGFQFLFFTVWNYVLQTVFWACAATASAFALWSPKGPSPALRRLVHILLSVCVPMSLLVSVVLWTVLAPHALKEHKPHSVLNFYSYNMHAANTVCLLIEAACDRMLIKRGTLAIILAWVLIYAAFTWVQNAFTHWWPYFFMRLDTYAAIGWYFALSLMNGVMYGVALALSHCKMRRQPSLVEPDASVQAGGPTTSLMAAQGA